ncbi:MAG: hypothetical protein ACLFTR_01030 [Candidatus Woesearchaeota archaeon]
MKIIGTTLEDRLTPQENVRNEVVDEEKQDGPDAGFPSVLAPRLGLNKEHRRLLKRLEKELPANSAILWHPYSDEKIPDFSELAKRTRKSKEYISERLNEIKDLWDLPEKLPSNNGTLDEEQALVLALANQHKLRWDEEISDYRVPRYHLYSSELGLGTLYTNTSAFEGERLVRKAMGLDEMLNSVHLQGGIMPQMVSFYGKLKNNRALLTGKNREYENLDDKEFNEIFYDETNDIKELLGRSSGDDLSPKEINNLRKYVINTIDSFEEAKASVAKELKPLIENVPNEVPIHIYYSYNDDFNLSEIETLLVEAWRKSENEANKAEEKLPGLYEKEGELKIRSLRENTAVSIDERLEDSYLDLRNRYEEGSLDYESYGLQPPEGMEAIEDALSGKKIREILGQEYFDKNSKGLKEFKKNLKKTSRGTMNSREFDELFWELVEKRLNNSKIRNLDDIIARLEADTKKRDSVDRKYDHTKDTIDEYEQLKLARESEKRSGHAWFTKQVHINPTVSKAIEMAQKNRYKKYYEDMISKELKSLLGEEKNIKLHTDRDISVYVPDPAQIYGYNSYPDKKLYGTIITSVPRTNRQRSNEPLKNSLAELIGKHENSVKKSILIGSERPRTIEEFKKRGSLAFSDVVFTGWGADGYNRNKKATVAPTVVKGEYRESIPMTNYLKLPTRHDTDILKEMGNRGNTGTWELKRIEKGGDTTGNVLQVMEPDGSEKWIFFNDLFYEEIAEKYSAQVRELESKIERARTQKSIDKHKRRLNALYEEIVPEVKSILMDNDNHYGVYNHPGRPSNHDAIDATQSVAEQRLGLENISMHFGSEYLNGNQSLGTKYDPARENRSLDDITMNMHVKILRERLKKAGYRDEEIHDHIDSYVLENALAKSVPTLEHQKELFKRYRQPALEELMDNGTEVYLSSGNHLNTTKQYGENEADILGGMFDISYKDEGKLHISEAGRGQSFSSDLVKVPTEEGHDMYAYLAHKMKSGRTEISNISTQAQGQRSKATRFLAADRHHHGSGAERNVYYAMDAGKQTVNPYVDQIGKVSSLRGTVAVLYGTKNENLHGTWEWMDDVTDAVIGWDERATMLKRCHDIIDEEYKGLHVKT